MTSDITEFESKYSKGTLRVRMIELDNGLLVLLSDSEKFRLGQSAVAIPPGQGRAEPTSAGVFSGALDSALIRTIAERIAALTGQTCMVVSGIREISREVMMEIVVIFKNHLVA
ncbi:MAG: hypothetical protein ACFFED_12990 [Candidatus Thorarchaeota archaeon]